MAAVHEEGQEPVADRARVGRGGLVGGPVLAILTYLVMPDTFSAAGELVELGHAGRVTAAAHLLFLGGFLLALAMQRWGLERRIALLALRLVGTEPRVVIGGFMVLTATFSIGVSNTAMAAMMLPIALSVIDDLLAQPVLGLDLPIR